MVVKHNLTSMNNGRCLSIITGREKKVSEKLSSGYRINRAADDAAGLSISEKMRKQIRGLTQASANAQDGISLLQSAEGALHEVHEKLHRMNILAVQAANGTNSAEDRLYLQEEVNKIIAEVDRVAVTTKFNEVTLLDGSCAAKKSESKAGTGKIMPKLTVSDEIVCYAVNVVQKPDTWYVTEAGSDELKEILKTQMVPQAVQAIADTFSNTFGYLNGSNIGIGLYLYDQPRDGVLASVGLKQSYWTSYTPPKFELDYRLSVNKAYLDFVDKNTGELTADSRLELESTIAHEMMHGMMMEALTAGMGAYDQWASLHGNGFPNWFVEGTAQAVGGGMDWVRGSLGLSEQSTETEIQDVLNHAWYSLPSDSAYSHYGTGYLAVMYLGYIVNGGASLAAADVAHGIDILMNEIRGGKSLDQAIADNTSYTGLTDFETKFGTDGAAFTKQLIAAAGNGRGALAAGDYTRVDVLEDTPMADSIFELNTQYHWVNNVYPDDYPVISGGSATTGGLQGPDYVPVTNAGGNAGTGGNTGMGGNTGVGGNTGTGTGSNNTGGAKGFDDAQKGGLSLQIGNEAEHQMTIFIEAMNSVELGIHEVDISTEDGAADAIEVIGEAISKVSAQRSALGAYQNRLEHTVRNLDNIVENTQAAESQIRDADMAKEMVELSNLRILRQTGQAMLAQTKRQNEGILGLLA